MAEKETYDVQENPVYNLEIRKLKTSDPANAETVFNPLFSKIINNVHAVKREMEEHSRSENAHEGMSFPANGGTAETISATLPIAKGGTGGITAEAARNNLGLADAYNKKLRYGTNYTDIFSKTLDNSHSCWNRWCAANGTNLNNAPEANTVWYEVFTCGISNRAFQLAIGCFSHQRKTYIRYLHDSVWSGWFNIADGGNADTVDNKRASDFAASSIYGNTAVSMGRKEDTTVGKNSFACGNSVEASGNCSHAEGSGTTASGSYSHAEGSNTTASDICSHAEGGITTASGAYSHTEGNSTTASGYYSHAEGYNTTASGSGSHAEGNNTASSNYSSHASGKFNKTMITGGGSDTQVGDVFVIGNGISSARSNALRVTYKGEVYGTQAFQSSGADYAEFIKPWFDGNETNEDRTGYFVTVKNNFLYKAREGDYIAGVTSGNPSVVGNADEDYYWKYERDEFNRIIMEDVEEEIQDTDEEGNPLFDEEHRPIMIKTGKIIPNARMKLSKDYVPAMQENYVERKDRKEWDYVGMVGVLPVRDDGTCVADGFCKCSDSGIATYTAEHTLDSFRVIERVSTNIVKIILK